MLLGEGRGGTDGEGVALEEDFAVRGGHDAGGGEWAGADGEKLKCAGSGWVVTEDAVGFRQGERWPIRGDEIAGESVRLMSFRGDSPTPCGKCARNQCIVWGTRGGTIAGEMDSIENIFTFRISGV